MKRTNSNLKLYIDASAAAQSCLYRPYEIDLDILAKHLNGRELK